MKERRMRTLNIDELKLVGGGWPNGEPPGQTGIQGNNGWGNGTDPINPGSDNGGSDPSKSTNSSQPGAGKINTDPTDSTGR
jgi:hypothetical protein